MSILLPLLLLLSFPDTISRQDHLVPLQADDWTKMYDWRLYYTHAKNPTSLSFDSLGKIPSIPLNKDTLLGFMKTAKRVTFDTAPAWMGYYLLTCKSPNGESSKLIVSHYGHFFLDLKNSNYYDLSERVSEQWKSFLRDEWHHLESVAQTKQP